MTYVYIAMAGEFVKIGCSSSPLNRIMHLQGEATYPNTPLPPTLVHSVVGGFDYENFLHRSLVRYCVGGEWYTKDCLTSDELVALLARPAEGRPKRINDRQVIRVSAETHARLKSLAKTERRTLEGMAEILLEEEIGEYEE